MPRPTGLGCSGDRCDRVRRFRPNGHSHLSPQPGSVLGGSHGAVPHQSRISHGAARATPFLDAEIREKAARWKASPYCRDDPKQLGTKGANSVTPFMLSLEQLGRAGLVEDYWEVFLLFGAAIQMIDDWQDLKGDLEIGHYSYVTLGAEDVIRTHDAVTTAAMLRADATGVRATYNVSKEMIAQARGILAGLDDRFLVRLVDITDLRLENTFRRDLKMA
jgi:hypothetical protein